MAFGTIIVTAAGIASRIWLIFSRSALVQIQSRAG